MDIQHPSRESRIRTTFRDTIKAPRAYPTKVLHSAARHLSMHAQPIAPTREQKQLVLTGLVLGSASVLTVFFPVCALPAAITGLLLGLYGRYTTPLSRMTSWTITLSALGLVLSIINIVMIMGTYVNSYVLK